MRPHRVFLWMAALGCAVGGAGAFAAAWAHEEAGLAMQAGLWLFGAGMVGWMATLGEHQRVSRNVASRNEAHGSDKSSSPDAMSETSSPAFHKALDGKPNQ